MAFLDKRIGGEKKEKKDKKEKKEKKAKAGLFSKDMKVGKRRKYPEKRYINFIQDDEDKNNKYALIGFAIFIVFLIFFVIFAVIRPMVKVSQAESEYTSKQEQMLQLQQTNKEYQEVAAKYDEIIGTFMTADELACVDRSEIFRMIGADIMNSVPVTSVAISGKKVTVHTGTTHLSTVSKVIRTLQADDRNGYVSMTYNASPGAEDSSDLVTADIIIVFGNADEADIKDASGN